MAPNSKPSLGLDHLRRANKARLPEFKNSRGEPAHRFRDGSDWSPAMWMIAMMGEVGELAQERVDYEEGLIGEGEYRIAAEKEFADMFTYGDIAAMRAFDKVTGRRALNNESPAQAMLTVIALVGQWCNLYKKFVRGDIDFDRFKKVQDPLLTTIQECILNVDTKVSPTREHPGDRVTSVNMTGGVDLSAAIAAKFNEISQRVNCGVRLQHGCAVRLLPDNKMELIRD